MRNRTAPTLIAAFVAALFALSPLAAASPALAAGESDVVWGVRTAENDHGTDRQSFSYELDPGTSLTDAFIITNHNAGSIDLDLYGADGFTTSSGQLDVVTHVAESTAVGAWIELGTDRVVIPAGESTEVPFTVTLPDNVTPGDYAGAVITSLVGPSVEQGLSVDRRLGIRMHLRIGGDLAPTLVIDNMNVDYAGTANPFGTGDASINYTVRNTGNARLAAGQAVSIAGPFGLFRSDAGDIDDVPELLPGEKWEVTVPITGVFPAFLLSATVALSPELPSTDGSVSALDPIEASATTWAVPLVLLIFILLVIASAITTIAVTRRNRRRRASREETRVDEAVQRALREREAESTLTH